MGNLDPRNTIAKKETGCIPIHPHRPHASRGQGVGKIDLDDAGAPARDEDLRAGPKRGPTGTT
ncbi:MAG: hypothetical protein M3O36_12195 [Myxococcota bacterium]|nr:hypothetical protein [Myxococcota bacterium]